MNEKSVKILRSDNDGKYKSECRIRHEFTVPKTPEQNGVAERLNRVLVEKVRTMSVQSRLPHNFWAEALTTALHVHNLSPSRVSGDKTARELFTGKTPNIAYKRSFDCTVFAHVPKDVRNKLDPKSTKCVFMGYGKTSKGYRVMILRRKGSFSVGMLFLMRGNLKGYYAKVLRNVHVLT